jgi:molybdenum cofactor cytidylyltransferase
MRPRIDAIVLAAGSSQRFGSDKRLFRLKDGTPMLQRSVKHALSVARQVRVVLREDDATLLQALLGSLLEDTRVLPVLLPDAAAGMGSNLARAVSVLPVDCAGVLVLLGDMPHIRPDTLRCLVEAFHPERIVFPVLHGQRGHPVLFPCRWFAELGGLEGDSGARTVLERAPMHWQSVPVEDEGVCLDFDYPPV